MSQAWDKMIYLSIINLSPIYLPTSLFTYYPSIVYVSISLHLMVTDVLQRGLSPSFTDEETEAREVRQLAQLVDDPAGCIVHDGSAVSPGSCPDSPSIPMPSMNASMV